MQRQVVALDRGRHAAAAVMAAPRRREHAHDPVAPGEAQLRHVAHDAPHSWNATRIGWKAMAVDQPVFGFVTVQVLHTGAEHPRVAAVVHAVVVAPSNSRGPRSASCRRRAPS